MAGESQSLQGVVNLLLGENILRSSGRSYPSFGGSDSLDRAADLYPAMGVESLSSLFLRVSLQRCFQLSRILLVSWWAFSSICSLCLVSGLAISLHCGQTWAYPVE